MVRGNVARPARALCTILNTPASLYHTPVFFRDEAEDDIELMLREDGGADNKDDVRLTVSGKRCGAKDDVRLIDSE